MEKPTLEYWSSVSDYMAEHEKYPSVSLHDSGQGYGLNCEVKPDGNIKLKTVSGGGHGEMRTEDNGRTAEDWVNLIHEAEKVRKHYWPNEKAEQGR